MPIAWPSVFKKRTCNAELRNFVKSGGRTGTGREQRVFSDAGFWEISYGEFRITEEPSILAYRAVIARLRQGEEIVAKIDDKYACKGIDPIRITANAPLKATAVQVQGVAAELQPGHHFSIGNRLHRVTEVLSQSEATVGLVTGTYTGDTWDDGDVWVDDQSVSSSIKFLPPLRSAVTANTLVEFDDLKCLCVLRDMADGDLDLDIGRFGTPSFTLIESI